jgi:hypothetical protein
MTWASRTADAGAFDEQGRPEANHATPQSPAPAGGAVNGLRQDHFEPHRTADTHGAGIIQRQVDGNGPAQPMAPFDTPYCERFREKMGNTPCNASWWDLIKDWSTRRCCAWHEFRCMPSCENLPGERRANCEQCCDRAACVCLTGGVPITPEGGCAR